MAHAAHVPVAAVLEPAIERTEEALLRGLARAARGFSIMVHRAGVSESATNTDSNIAETIVSENCRYMAPPIRLRKPLGRTPRSAPRQRRPAPGDLPIALRVASRGDRPPRTSRARRFDNHDRVIDQQPDREHQAEHRQRVDRETEGGHDSERSEQHDRHRDGRNQRRAQVLQEQVHHQEDERDTLEQRFHDLRDRRSL